MADRCPKCGKKIGKTDKLKKRLMSQSMAFSERAMKEWEEVKDWCPKCITAYFKPKFKEALGQLKEEAIPEKFKGIIKKAKKEAEK